MSSIISPFLLNKTRPREEFSSRQNEYFDLLERIAEQLYTRTGGPSDSIAASDFAPVSSSPLNADSSFSPVYGINTDPEGSFLPAATTFDVAKFNPVSASSNYTAGNFDFVSATSSITVDLPLYPCNMCSVIVRNGDGTDIVIDGNGRNINGEASITSQVECDSFHLYYFRQDNEWFIS